MVKQLSQKEIDKLSEDIKYGNLGNGRPELKAPASSGGFIIPLILALANLTAAAVYSYLRLSQSAQGGSPRGVSGLFWPLAWLVASVLLLAGSIRLVILKLK